MKRDYFRESTVLDNGKKKIYKFKKGNFDLKLPDGKSVGFLEEEDLVYRVKVTDENGKRVLSFRVLKFAKTPNMATVFKADRNLFTKAFKDDDKSNIDGDVKTTVKKVDFGVPAVAGVGLGTVGFLVARKFNKNPWLFGLGGLVVGGAVGYYISNKGMNKKDIKIK